MAPEKDSLFDLDLGSQDSLSPQTDDALRDAFSNYFSEDELVLLFRDSKTPNPEPEAVAIDLGEPNPEPQLMPSKEQPEQPRTEQETVSSRKTPRPILLCAILVVLLAVAGGILYVVLSAAADPYDGRILENVTVAGVKVSGMTLHQAKKAVAATVKDSYKHTDMVVQFPDTALRFSPADTGIDFDVKGAVQAAYDFGRSGDIAQQQADYLQSLEDGLDVELLPYLSLNETFIRDALDDYAAGYTETYVPSSYRLEGAMPALSETEFDPDAPCQTLLLTSGTPGFGFEMDEVFQQVLDAYRQNVFLVDLSDGVVYDEPEPLDLQEVYDQLCIAPVEPQIDKTTCQVTPGSYGYTFDLEEAQTLLAGAAPGQTVQLPMECVAPTLLGDAVYFQDTLGYCVTPHSKNEKRNNNLSLACASLDGLVLQPGETISYNDTLGKRTKENGYMAAPAYSGTALVDSIGGGICQVSSTLYLASLFAELEIVERVNHGFPVSYMPPGLDATVSWGAPDLKIKNNLTLPVQIQAEVSDGFVKIKLMGTDLRDYTVRIGFRANDHYARSILCKYAPDGTLISKTNGPISSYMSGNLSAYGELGNGQAYINGNVRTPEFATEAADP